LLPSVITDSKEGTVETRCDLIKIYQLLLEHYSESPVIKS